MSEDLILFDEFESYAVITFNRPEKPNALSTPLQLVDKLTGLQGIK